jgi:hypothetical protein
MPVSVIGTAWVFSELFGSLIVIISSTDVSFILADSLDLVYHFAIQIPESCAIVSDKHTIVCLLSSAFSNSLSALEFNADVFEMSCRTNLSFVSNEALPDASPLLKSTFVLSMVMLPLYSIPYFSFT